MGGPVSLTPTPIGSGVLGGTGSVRWLWWVWLLVIVVISVAILGGLWLMPPMSGTLRIDRMRPSGDPADDLWDDIGRLPLSGRSQRKEVVDGLRHEQDVDPLSPTVPTRLGRV